jgi:hypothetical protein
MDSPLAESRITLRKSAGKSRGGGRNDHEHHGQRVLDLLRYWMTPVDSERFVPERGLLTVGGAAARGRWIFKAVFLDCRGRGRNRGHGQPLSRPIICLEAPTGGLP